MAEEQQVDRYGSAFDGLAAIFDSLSPLVWDRISRDAVELLDVGAGDRVLDLCCGTGAAAIPLGEVVGPGGCVDGVDHAPALLTLAERRAAGVPQVRFHAADVAQWQRSGTPYDRVACVLGAFFVPDRETVFRSLLADNLRRGGRAVITSWTSSGLQPLGDLLWNAVERRDPQRLRGVDPPGRGLAGRDALYSFGTAIGLDELEVHERPAAAVVDTDQVWALCTGTAFAPLLDGLSEAQRRSVRADLDAGMAAHGWRLDLSARHLTGRRPSPGDRRSVARV